MFNGWLYLVGPHTAVLVYQTVPELFIFRGENVSLRIGKLHRKFRLHAGARHWKMMEDVEDVDVVEVVEVVELIGPADAWGLLYKITCMAHGCTNGPP